MNDQRWMDLNDDKPDPRKMHCHSIKAYHEEHPKLSARSYEILALCKDGRSRTDREIKDSLFGMASDMNTVRPRITELIEARLLRELGQTKDHVTGKTVRVVGLA